MHCHQKSPTLIIQIYILETLYHFTKSMYNKRFMASKTYCFYEILIKKDADTSTFTHAPEPSTSTFSTNSNCLNCVNSSSISISIPEVLSERVTFALPCKGIV